MTVGGAPEGEGVGVSVEGRVGSGVAVSGNTRGVGCDCCVGIGVGGITVGIIGMAVAVKAGMTGDASGCVITVTGVAGTSVGVKVAGTYVAVGEETTLDVKLGVPISSVSREVVHAASMNKVDVIKLVR